MIPADANGEQPGTVFIVVGCRWLGQGNGQDSHLTVAELFRRCEVRRQRCVSRKHVRAAALARGSEMQREVVSSDPGCNSEKFVVPPVASGIAGGPGDF